MCEICKQTPCHNMCPNADRREAVTCCKCGSEWFPEEKDEYITFSNGDVVCNGCLHGYCEENFI